MTFAAATAVVVLLGSVSALVLVAKGYTRRRSVRKCRLVFADGRSEEIWTQLQGERPSLILIGSPEREQRDRALEEQKLHHRPKPPCACLYAEERRTKDARVWVIPIAEESLIVVASRYRTSEITALIAERLRAAALYLKPSPQASAHSATALFIRYLLGFRSDPLYEIQWLLRRRRIRTTEAGVNLFVIAGSTLSSCGQLRTGHRYSDQ